MSVTLRILDRLVAFKIKAGLKLHLCVCNFFLPLSSVLSISCQTPAEERIKNCKSLSYKRADRFWLQFMINAKMLLSLLKKSEKNQLLVMLRRKGSGDVCKILFSTAYQYGEFGVLYLCFFS